MTLGNNVEIDLEGEVCLPFAGECTIRIVKEHSFPREDANGSLRMISELTALGYDMKNINAALKGR